MNNFVIMTESTADLPFAIVKELDIKVLGMTFMVDGEEYTDNPMHTEMSIDEFYTRQKAGAKISTSALNPTTITEAARPILSAGTNILHIAFSSGISASCNNAKKACEDFEKENLAGKYVVIDSKAASMGQGLMVYLAAQKRKSGASFEDVIEYTESIIDKLAHWFTVDDLFHLKRGGRISGATAILGSALSIKPVMHVDNDGKLVPVTKVRGRKQSLDKLVEVCRETADNIESQTVFISQAASLSDAEYVKDSILKSLKAKEVIIGDIGSTIGSHSGAGTVSLFFLAHKK